ncbi:M4 family metallopeptidase [Hyalangium versicolor]|uniref:M4 family metallopeptidase n=1 Tax=Hyalangium versicolor TaxID=2861190 RepID=UPI001CCA25FA|nr:M4 family metallopeptidase [Hyalangium versicolor]
MVRNRIVAALLATLPLAACEMADPESAAPGTQKVEELEIADVQSALAALPSARVVGAHDNGVPYMISGQLGTAKPAVGLTLVASHDRVAQSLPSIASVFRMNASDLAVSRVFTDEQGDHIRYQQLKNGLPVVGEELIIHVDRAGNIYAANGTARDGEIASAKPAISADAAKESALRSTMSLGRHIDSEGEPRLVYIRSGQDQKLKLAYEQLVVGEGREQPIRERVYINAVDGSTLERRSEIRTALNRKVYSSNNGTSTPGTLKRSEGQAAVSDSTVNSNYDALGATYNCYKTNFNRDSFDNAGATYISSVHYSTNYVNAYWDGTQMVYGDGDGVNSISLAIDKDVTTHELTHAVTERTSNLTYSGESGGLNEAMSDTFAAICQSWENSWSTATAIWQIGEAVWTPGTSGDALRYMDDPAKDGGSLDYWTSSAGTKDVHYSSGIANLAFALVSKGGTHPRGKSSTVVTGIGVQKAGQIWYKANTSLFTASTTFAQAKTYTEQAATSLGYTTAEVASVTAAWTAVGVTGGSSGGTATALTNGVAKTSLSGSSGSSTYYYLDVPASKAVTFVTSGGSGDADLYVKFGAQPTTASYDCRPYITGNAETCNMAAKTTAGRYYVMLNGYTSYSGLSLKGTYTP